MLYSILFVKGGKFSLYVNFHAPFKSKPIPGWGREDTVVNSFKYIFGVKWKPIFFSLSIPKFELQIQFTFGDRAENVPIYTGIPISIFVCIFITASSPVSYTYIAPEEKIRSNLEVKLYKMCPRGQGQSLENEKYTFQNGHIPFKQTWWFKADRQDSIIKVLHICVNKIMKKGPILIEHLIVLTMFFQTGGPFLTISTFSNQNHHHHVDSNCLVP